MPQCDETRLVPLRRAGARVVRDAVGDNRVLRFVAAP